MTVARIQPRLQESRCTLVAQQLQHFPFRIDEIDLPPHLLERLDMREKFGEDDAGVTVERQNALRRLALDALDHTAAEAGMQVEETCGTRRRETLVERSARFLRAQGVFLGQQEGAQMRKGLGTTFVMPAEAGIGRSTAGRRGSPGHRIAHAQSGTQGGRRCLIGGQVAHFEKAEIRLKIGRPVTREKRRQRLAGRTRVEFRLQCGDDFFRNDIRIGIQRQPFAATTERSPDQALGHFQACQRQQTHEPLRGRALRVSLQFRREGLPEFVE